MSVVLVALLNSPVAQTESPFRLDGDARFADISSDGELVAFESNASNLVKPAPEASCAIGRRNGDTGPIVYGICQNVYVRDLSSKKTTLIAAGSHPLISGDGRYIAFDSGQGLGSGDTQTCSGEGMNGRVTYNCSDVYVHDVASGDTQRVSLLPDGSQPKADSHVSWISPDGSMIAFGIEQTSGLYLWERSKAVVSLVAGASGSAALSASGRYVAFDGYDKSLVPGDKRDCSLSNCQDIILLDRSTGKRTLVSRTYNGKAPNGPNFAMPSISANGRYIAFWSEATNLLPGNKKTRPVGLGPDVYVYDASKKKLSLVSVSMKGGFGKGFSGHPRITPDGRFVAFFSDANDLVRGDRDRPDKPDDVKIGDVFVRDLRLGETVRVSVSSAEQQGNNASTCCGDPPAISADGAVVAFSSAASNFSPSNASQEGVFVRDVKRGTTLLASVPVAAASNRNLGPPGGGITNLRDTNSAAADGGPGVVALLVLGFVLVSLGALAIVRRKRKRRADVTVDREELQAVAKL